METRQAIETVWRIEAPRLLGGLVRMVGDLDHAEDLAQEALVAALEAWPSGLPDNPGAWLMRVAKNRAMDQMRRGRMAEEKLAQLGARASAPASEAEEELVRALDEDVGDDMLRLILVACNPILSRDARVALTLRLLGGLETEEIARAFLASPATVAQRIVRAKRTLKEARVPFDVPRGEELTRRLESVLEVIYLIFNEGYSATAGDDWIRPELCQDALRLGRVLAELVPDDPEVHGLVVLMELQASRLRARVTADGEPILLTDQDRSRWDHLLIRRGLAALRRAEALPGPAGPYALQAAIAACHARAPEAAATDWPRIVALYDALAELTRSPVVELNRAVAVGMAFGPAEGFALVEQIRDHPALDGYYLLHAVRADFLIKLGRFHEARQDLERAAALATNDRDHTLLVARARSLQGLQQVK